MARLPRIRIPWLPLLAAGIVAALAQQYWLAPFAVRERQMRQEMADLATRAEHARAAVKMVQDLEQESAAARVAFQRWQSELPKGSAIVWLPPRIKEHFARFGLPVPVARLNATLPEPGLPRLKRSFWAVEIPLAHPLKDTTAALLAVAELDQQDALVRVLDFAVRPDSRKTGRQVATLNLSVIAGQ